MSFRFLLQPAHGRDRRAARRHQGCAARRTPYLLDGPARAGPARRSPARGPDLHRPRSSCSGFGMDAIYQFRCSAPSIRARRLLIALLLAVVPYFSSAGRSSASRAGGCAAPIQHMTAAGRPTRHPSPPIRSGPDLRRAVVAAHRHVVPAHAHERRPHADVGDPHLAVADQLRLHDLPGVREAARCANVISACRMRRAISASRWCARHR